MNHPPGVLNHTVTKKEEKKEMAIPEGVVIFLFSPADEAFVPEDP